MPRSKNATSRGLIDQAAARVAPPIDEARLAREWPERFARWESWNRKYWEDHDNKFGPLASNAGKFTVTTLTKN